MSYVKAPIVIKPTDFWVTNYYYDQPKLKFDIIDVQFKYDYHFQFYPPFDDFSVKTTLAMLLPKLRESRPPLLNKLEFSKIETVTKFSFSKNEWVALGILNRDNELNSNKERLIGSIASLVYNALAYTKDALYKRGIDTEMNGLVMSDIPFEVLIQDIEKRELIK